jgi:2-hydroxychromene-2-carboxylate isomerase
MRIEALAGRTGVPLHWKPFLLGPIFRELGWQSSPFAEQREKGEYVWRDMARRAAKHGIPFKRPSSFPRRAVLPLRVALLGAEQVWMGEFCRRIMLRNWAQDADIDDADTMLVALEGLVPDPAAILGEAQGEANKTALRAQTEAARRLGIFGAPSFIVRGELFWGDDRLEDAIEFAQAL